MTQSHFGCSQMEIRNKEKIGSFEAKDGSIVREIFHPNNSAVENQSIAEARVGPSSKTKKHAHMDSEEIYYILSGEGTIHIGEESSKVKNGDVVLIPPGSFH